jgi:hypothetical protein
MGNTPVVQELDRRKPLAKQWVRTTTACTLPRLTETKPMAKRRKEEKG